MISVGTTLLHQVALISFILNCNNIDIKEEKEGELEKAGEFDSSHESVLEGSPEKGTIEPDFSISKTVKKIRVGTVKRVAKVIRQVSGPLRRKKYMYHFLKHRLPYTFYTYCSVGEQPLDIGCHFKMASSVLYSLLLIKMLVTMF